MVSVVLPSFNRARCIARAMDSVLNQTFTDLELIVVDDGSTDGTKELVEGYADSRVRYVQQEHEGACAARNRGIREARGEYIAFQDSDDEWLPEKLEKQMACLKESGSDIVCSAFYRAENGSKERFPPDCKKENYTITLCDIIPENLCSTQTLLFKKKCFQGEMFDTNLRRLQDWELMIRMVQKWKVLMINEPLVIQYNQQDSISKNTLAYLPALMTIFREVSDKYKEQNAYVKELEHQLSSVRTEYQAKEEQLTSMYAGVVNSSCWKMTKPIRYILDHWKAFMLNHGITSRFYRGMRFLWRHGIVEAWRKTARIVFASRKQTKINKKTLEEQRKYTFPKKVKFSILVPLYNTPERFLREMLQSVQDQTYSDWELCLADGSDDGYSAVESICKEYAARDSRILYKRLEKNLGISGNTNACLDMATGEYISLFDHDDRLHPSALFEVMKAICDQNADFIYTDENAFHKTPKDAFCPHFKPDFAPDTLRSYNYICHFTTFERGLLEKAGGGFRAEFDGSQDYDMILRLTEQAEHIVHIPKILYYWRSSPNSVASDISEKHYTIVSAKKALSQHLTRVGLKGTVLDSAVPSTYKIAYEIDGEPMISILIPNYENIDTLKTCLNSIYDKTTYRNFEIIIIENNSKTVDTFDYYEQIQKRWDNLRVVKWSGKFNYSAINNFGAKYANGDVLLLLNNDIEVITPDWLEQMLMFAQRKDVGAVGAMLYYPDNTVQHAGVILGIGGVGSHAHKNFRRGDCGYMSRMTIAQNYSCVTAACVMMRRAVWDEIGGLDESFEVAFNDVDMCMRIRKAGYLVVWTPYAELYHYESKSRGLEDTPEKQKRFQGEVLRFQNRWEKELQAGDPYYNPNLTLDREDFSAKI